jgi:DNA-binding GntR family transcriptional regulator
MNAAFDNRNLNERTYLYLRDKIFRNELEPGARINYEELIEELGISRTPLRDALNRLQQDGLIEVKPRSGTFVSTPKPKDIEEIYDLRKGMESLAVELAAPHIPEYVYEELLADVDEVEEEIRKGNIQPFFESDRKLHRTIVQYSGNQRLINFMETLEVQIKWFGIIITKNSARPLQANKMHKKLLTAMNNGDIEEAKKLMGQHIEEIKNHIIGDYT